MPSEVPSLSLSRSDHAALTCLNALNQLLAVLSRASSRQQKNLRLPKPMRRLSEISLPNVLTDVVHRKSWTRSPTL